MSSYFDWALQITSVQSKCYKDSVLPCERNTGEYIDIASPANGYCPCFEICLHDLVKQNSNTMSKRKKNNRLKKWHRASKSSAPPKENLSDIWYKQDEVLKLLGLSPTTCYRRRASGVLIASKQHGKLYYNAYHIQKMLKDGLPPEV